MMSALLPARSSQSEPDIESGHAPTGKKGLIPSLTMYVQSFEPERPTKSWPIVLIHGTGQTGNNFLATADGRPGWAHDFAARGYRVYVVDQVGRGRSGTSAAAYGNYAVPALPFVQLILGVPEAGLWPQVKLHTQWPGTMQPGDPAFDQFMASQVEFR